MIAVSYTFTPTIREYLLEIDRFRRIILLTPLPVLAEYKLRWSAVYDQIFGSLQLADTPITKAGLTHILFHPGKHPTAMEKQALAYKYALEVIRSDWTANPKQLFTSHIGAISLIAQPQIARQNMRALRESEEDIKRLLSYTSAQKDHPLILAGILYGQLMHADIGVLTHGLIPRLLVRIILAKYGYDCRGMISLEPQWISRTEDHKKALKSIETYTNLTVWLEHFINAARESYGALYEKIQNTGSDKHAEVASSSWSLNTREESLLRYLETPQTKITNKIAQQLFRVSQVTASRDLSHLTALGLLLTHGKGRSVYYTKA